MEKIQYNLQTGFSVYRQKIEYHINRILKPFGGFHFYRITNYEVIPGRTIVMGDETIHNELVCDYLSEKERSLFHKDDIIFYIPHNRFTKGVDDIYACKLAIHNISSFIAHFSKREFQEYIYISALSLLANNTIGINNVHDIIEKWEGEMLLDMEFKRYFSKTPTFKKKFADSVELAICLEKTLPPYDFSTLFKISQNMQALTFLQEIHCLGSA